MRWRRSCRSTVVNAGRAPCENGGRQGGSGPPQCLHLPRSAPPIGCHAPSRIAATGSGPSVLRLLREPHSVDTPLLERRGLLGAFLVRTAPGPIRRTGRPPHDERSGRKRRISGHLPRSRGARRYASGSFAALEVRTAQEQDDRESEHSKHHALSCFEGHVAITIPAMTTATTLTSSRRRELQGVRPAPLLGFANLVLAELRQVRNEQLEPRVDQVRVGPDDVPVAVVYQGP
jgi:hypothetical protein